MIDFSTYSDEDLAEVRVDLVNECERRQRLATAAETVAAVTARYAEDGGDPADLLDVVTSAVEG